MPGEITQRDRDNRDWHSPRPWRVEEQGSGFVVVDAIGICVTVSVCREDAEKIAALGNATNHEHK